MNFKNFNFGAVGDKYAVSHLGIAVRNAAGEMVSYDKTTNEIINVDLLNFKQKNFIWSIPIAIKDVAIGDAVVHNNIVMFITDICEDSAGFVAIDPAAGESKVILPSKSMFGFNFMNKLVSLTEMVAGNQTADAENPFGGMLPMMMLCNDGKMDMSKMFMFSMLSGGNMADMFNFKDNPTMAFMMMSMLQDNSNSNPFFSDCF